MEGLPTSILPSEARFAHVTSAFRLAEIYVPVVRHTDVLSGCLYLDRSLVAETWPQPAANSAVRLSLPERSRTDHKPVPLRLATLLWKEFLACGAVRCPCSAACS